jgi:hypothetical protein
MDHIIPLLIIFLVAGLNAWLLPKALTKIFNKFPNQFRRKVNKPKGDFTVGQPIKIQTGSPLIHVEPGKPQPATQR